MVFATLLAVSLAAPADVEEQPTIVVTPIAAQRNVDEGLVNLLGELMLTELDKQDEYEIIGYSDIQAMMDNESNKQMLGCDGTSCLAELGEAMGAGLLIHANLGKIGASYLLNVKLIDVTKASVRKRLTRQVSGEEQELIEEMRVAVAELMSVPPPEPLPPPPSEGGPVLPTMMLISGGSIAVIAAGAGTLFGVLSLNEIKFSPVDARYAASVEAAEGWALWSTTSWIVAGAATAVAAGGIGLSLLE